MGFKVTKGQLMAPKRLRLQRDWVGGKQLGQGGFAPVFEVASGSDVGAAKLIPKDPGAERELLFVDLDGVRNVVPVVDSGETRDDWVIVMPRAECSLRWRLDEADRNWTLDEALKVIEDIATALADLDGRVVHRDLKPENILLLDGVWCLADFGISRYAEAATATNTRKFAMTPEYAAPERWRHEHATEATDVYSLGIVAFEMLNEERPFEGPTLEDYREQHLHEAPPPIEGAPAALAALVEECLTKAPAARPSAANILARLERIRNDPVSPGLARLQEANRAEVDRRAEIERHESRARTASERRTELFTAAQRSLDGIMAELREAIEGAAPAASFSTQGGLLWEVNLGAAILSVSRPRQSLGDPWGSLAPAFDVIGHTDLVLRVPPDQSGYQGRGHSLWYCDAVEAGRYLWFETAFMFNPLMEQPSRLDPFPLDPGEESAQAVGPGMGAYQAAWPFTPLVIRELDEFINRWGEWFAEASQGRLSHPSQMPKHSAQGSWRRE